MASASASASAAVALTTAGASAFPPLHTLTRRPSIYGTEDRIVLDIGSLYIKCGFSGEPRPRHIIPVFAGARKSRSPEGEGYRVAGEFAELFKLDVMSDAQALQYLEDRLTQILHDIYFRYLLTDPKQRKIIICESPLAPVCVKQVVAKVLFQNFQVPSISWAPLHLLALLTTGLTTGLVVDCGNLESTVLPIYAARPLTPFIRTTPLAGSSLTSRLRDLLLEHGRIVLPSNLHASAAPRNPVPEKLLTHALLEDVKTRFLFVSPVSARHRSPRRRSSARPSPAEQDEDEDEDMTFAFATDVKYPVRLDDQHGQNDGNSVATLIIPGWVRERAAEVLFEGDEDEASVAGCILDVLVKLQPDLRRPLISSILLIGGTTLLPGFETRLHQELLHTLRNPSELERIRYARHLSGVAESIAFLDDPEAPHGGSGRVFMGNCRGWVGGAY
ncbi:actin-domain-containing protein [Jimgerdemannia flammicorona]|uniref:Actin-domain-containing protein n=1 Tax=Jimgerdemannia flammicorona TaxID=994334 RepID=A0A433D6L5_9FUNG|nr:actin-domain-containing protein [Jimgerdemannia flammicorona]